MSNLVARFEPQFEAYMAEKISTDAAHDINHIKRVVGAARQFATEESAQLEVVIPAAWLHDCITLPKNAPNRHEASGLAAKEAVRWLTEIDYPEAHLDAIAHAVESHSFSAGITPTTLEAKIVQDADRIDALGAIGIARCLMVGGALNSTLYHTDDPFCDEREPDDRSYSIDHFYRKLFKIAKTMNTQAATEEAQRRVDFMQVFLHQLDCEINPGQLSV